MVIVVRLLTETIPLRRIRWLEHVLLMILHRLVFHAIFAHAGKDCKKHCGGQAMAWYRGMMQLILVWASFGGSSPLGLDQGDEDCCWLDSKLYSLESKPTKQVL